MPNNMDQDHVITIDSVQIMKIQMKKPPKLLNKFASKSSCCIFRVPQSLVEINKEAYQPRIVSIGPYHYGNKALEMIQEHKWRFLDDMLTRTGKSLDDLMNIILLKENEIRESYSESLDLDRDDLATMMVLDGVFMIELFRKVGKVVNTHQDNPIFKMGWILPFLMRALLRMENQIPFFVLKTLFEKSRTGDHTLQSLILEFFNYMVDRPKEALQKYKKSFINRSLVDSEATDQPNPFLKVIQPATELLNAGVKFKANPQADSFLDVKFKNGVLSIPQINMDDFHSSFLLNCMAFEQCYFHCSKDITTYVVFMGCLMNTSADVRLLSRNKIIENYFGTDKEIAKFFKDVGKDVAFDIKSNYLTNLFVKLNEYSKNGLHVTWARFKHTYFESPCASISAFAAFTLLSFAALRTFYTVFQYYHKD